MNKSIKQIRKTLGLSQSELATKLGMSTRAVQSWEQGWRTCPPPTRILLETWTKEKEEK